MLKNSFVNIGKIEYSLVDRVLKNKKISGKAKVVNEYEQALVETFNSPYALACSNGTAALQLSFYALNISFQDEVILPPTAPIMTILPILSVGAKPIFVDIDKIGFGLSLQDLKLKITDRTKAIISVPMWGYPVEIDKVVNLANEYNIPVIEDCSQAHFTKLKAKPLGTYADIGVFSTHERKLISTGEGAFILLKNKNLLQKFQSVRFFGISTNTQNQLPQLGVNFGLNYKLGALGAALGLGQILKLSKKIEKRTQNAQLIKSQINADWLSELKYTEYGIPNYYSIVMETTLSYNKLKHFEQYMFDNQIVSDTYKYQYKPLYKFDLFKQAYAHCTNAEQRCASILTLPVHEGLSEQDIEHIVNVVNNY